MNTPNVPTTGRTTYALARWLCVLVAVALAALLVGTSAVTSPAAGGGAHSMTWVAATTALAPNQNPGTARMAPPGFVAAPAPPTPIPNPGLPSNPAPTQTPTPAPGGMTRPPPAPPQVEEPGWIERTTADLLDGFFRTLVADALNPLLQLMGTTVLSSPTPDQLPHLTELWQVTRGIAVSLYVLLVLAASLIAGAYQTLQTRYSVGALLPRLVIGFLLINTSLWVMGQATVAANGLARALLGDGADPDRAAAGIRHLASSATTTGAGLWVVLVLAALLVLVIALVIGWAVRIALLAAMIVTAPLALACHGLPHTERLAVWWWRVVGALLAAQVGQALVMAVALRVLFDPGGTPTIGAATSTGNQTIMSLFLLIAVVGVMVKIPIWALSSARLGQGGSLLRSVVRTWLAYKSLGLLARGGSVAAAAGTRRRPGGLVDRRPPVAGGQPRGTGGVGVMSRARSNRLRRPTPTPQEKISRGFAGRFRSRIDADRAPRSRPAQQHTTSQRMADGFAGLFGARVVRPTAEPQRRLPKRGSQKTPPRTRAHGTPPVNPTGSRRAQPRWMTPNPRQRT